MHSNGTRSAEKAARNQADARGVPADIMLPRVVLMVSVILLVLIGLVMVFSASTVEAIADEESVLSYVSKQAIFVGIGALGALIVAKLMPYHIWRSGPVFYIFWGLACVLLVAVLLVGTEALGAQRWIYIGPFSLQPTEFAKIILVIGAARIMCDLNEGAMNVKQAAVWFFVLVLAPLAFLYETQSDMGSAIIILMGVFAVAWLGEVPLKLLVPVVLVLVVVAAVAMSTGYRAERVKVWLNPWNDGEGGYGTGFQLIHSYYAFSQGGLFGVGLGNSREKFLYLPEAETDFIFSIIGEELGMVGALAVIALFIAFLYAGLRIAAKAPDEFGKILAGSLTVMLVGQAFLNMACATGLFPTTGKPLPFISSGGSSVISSLLIVGVLMSVSYGSNVLTPYEQRRNNLNVLRVESDASASGDSYDMNEGRGRTRRSGSRGAGDVASLGSSRGRGGRNRSAARQERDALSGESLRSAGPGRRSDRNSRASEAPGSRRSSGMDTTTRSSRSRSSDLRLGTGRDRTYYDDRRR
ncbi:FtsW/RodA/SpoVE family cell cycle protein [uncultured Slackia sp.]|uniref:FtsW/RodA/SpoVE family cell cycle protein n=1 Tax=uncultured Slackia sp. TaxID=665903 RepID=UPI0025EC07AF|nr:putative peptidoglycan glycosyltransferase FtsW [uncultured Slackia sp.]